MQFPELDLPLTTAGASEDRGALVVLVGPTAVGKTELAIELALRLSGEIVSADSRLFYRGMDIGTAKPSIADRHGIPHHLIDIADPDEPLSLAVFQRLAAQAILQIQACGRLPILVGGTGQYIRAVIQGWAVPPVEPDPQLRAALEAWEKQIGKDGLHARLALLDPQAAGSIDSRNVRRTIRALEVILTTGRPFSAQRSSGLAPYRFIMIGLTRSRQELYTRIDTRIDAMLQSGFVQEVQVLLARGYSPDLPTLSAIGYREIIAYLLGRLPLEEAATQMKRQTRIFVRRQANWFKPDDPHIHWFNAGHEDTLSRIESLILSWLSGR